MPWPRDVALLGALTAVAPATPAAVTATAATPAASSLARRDAFFPGMFKVRVLSGGAAVRAAAPLREFPRPIRGRPYPRIAAAGDKSDSSGARLTFPSSYERMRANRTFGHDETQSG